LEQLRGVTPSNQVLHELHKQVIAVAETTLTYASLQRDIAAALGDGKNNKRVQQLIRKQAQVGMQLARHSAEIELIGEKLARESPNLARELKMIP
jgi:hypothetical protein